MNNNNKGEIMNKLTKVGLSALAGSLAVVSANASEYSVTGDTQVVFSSAEGNEAGAVASNGKGYGVDTDLYFTASGETDNGWTVSVFTAMDMEQANAATSGTPTLSATGGDTNIGISILPKGSGKITLDNITLPAADGTADQVLTTDGSGQLSFVDNTGGTDWQAVKTSDFTAVGGEGYFVNTTGGAVIVTLPGSASQGDEVSIIDYAGTADTNNITINRNSHKIQGDASNLTISTERAGFTLVYVDATQGWLLKDK